MSSKNQIPGKIRLSVTLASTTSPSSPVVLGGDLLFNIQKASALGYDGIELHWADPKLIDLRNLAEACKANDIVISAFATGRAYVQDGLSLISDDETIRKLALERLFSFIDAAAPFSSTVIIGCIRGNLPPAKEVGPYLDMLAKSTNAAAKYAADKGVPIVFEAINRYENNYLNSAAETIKFIKNYGLTNTGILLDTFHMNIEDPDLENAIIQCKDLLGYVHFADSNRLFTGAGHINFANIAETFQKIEYNGFISAECLPLPDSDTAMSGWIKGVKTAFKV
jgi:sugar phosphate isomerase/epimerase